VADLSGILAQLRSAQETSIAQQQHITNSVNTAVAGGIGGLASVADALDSLRQRPGGYLPLGTSFGDSERVPAFHQALASVAQAQLDATNRNAHIAQAVTAAVAGGTDALSEVAAGLRALKEVPMANDPMGLPAQYQSSLDWIRRNTSSGDSPPSAAYPTAAAYPTPQAPVICPTCAGTGWVTFG